MIISITFLLTLTLAFTLPSPSAIAQGIITPSPSPEVSSEVTPEVTGETTPVVTTSVTPEVTPKADIKAKREFKTDINFSVKARELVEKKTGVSKDKLKIAKEREVNFGFSGKRARAYKFIDDKGKISGLTLDEDGEETAFEALVAEDLKARNNKYGKFAQGFYEKLAKEPEDKPVKATLTLKIPHYSPPPRPSFRLSGNDSALTDAQIDDLNKKELELYKSHAQPVYDAAIAKLKAKGFKISQESTLGALSLEITPKDLREIQQLDEIDSITDVIGKNIAALASARSASGIAAVNSNNMTGSGINVAQIEVGGRVIPIPPTPMPQNTYLSTTNIIQDQTNVCPETHDHAAYVAGILKSNNLANVGIAPAVNLWASGSCSGNDWELYERAYNAQSAQNSNLINLSYSCVVSGNPLCERYPNVYPGLHDRISFYSTHPSIVVAAGNNENGTHSVYGIASAYNVLTVGAYDDKMNSDVFDDTMWEESDWQNPTDINGITTDREKPDVVAPGVNVRSTGYNVPLWERSGTSASAPIVTGGSALLMQRANYLKSEPEALKAIILVSARNDVARDGQMPSGDSRDGYGGVDFDWAYKLVTGVTGGDFEYGDLYCNSAPNPVVIPMLITSTTQIHPYRAIFTWRVDPDAPSYSSQPNMDLDIVVKDPNGSPVGWSNSWQNNVEGVYFVPTIAGTYTMEVSKYSCNTPYTHTRYAAAWNPTPAYLAEYFNNKTLSGTPVLRRYEDFINHTDWGIGSPGSGVNNDNFSARFTKTDNFNIGTYEFKVKSDDGVRLYVDNVKIIDKWFDQGPTEYSATRLLNAGNHTIKLEYYESVAGAEVSLKYEKITPIVSNGVYRLVNQCSGKVLDVSGGSTANGANVQQWGWANVGQQKWKITSLSGGYYRLTPQHSTNKALQVAGSSQLDGGNVNQGTWNSGYNNQQWIISNAGAEFSKLIAKHSSKALDVYWGSLNDGANIDQWYDNNTCAQKWRLDKM